MARPPRLDDKGKRYAKRHISLPRPLEARIVADAITRGIDFSTAISRLAEAELDRRRDTTQ